MGNLTDRNEHVGEQLSGYIDDELTQQEKQRVWLHCETCVECGARLKELQTLRDKVGKATFSNLDRDAWRESMDDIAVKAARGIGWLLFIGGSLLAIGIVVYEFISNAVSLSLAEKLIICGLYGGMLLLFLSVLRQRFIERKSDKYKDVEI